MESASVPLRAYALLAFAFSATACSALLDVQKTQCSSTDDCRALGFVGAVCTSGLCVNDVDASVDATDEGEAGNEDGAGGNAGAGGHAGVVVAEFTPKVGFDVCENGKFSDPWDPPRGGNAPGELYYAAGSVGSSYKTTSVLSKRGEILGLSIGGNMYSGATNAVRAWVPGTFQEWEEGFHGYMLRKWQKSGWRDPAPGSPAGDRSLAPTTVEPNAYVPFSDSRAVLYVPWDDKLLWLDQGVFNTNPDYDAVENPFPNQWIYGSRFTSNDALVSPVLPDRESAYVKDLESFGRWGADLPNAWCEDLETHVLLTGAPALHVIERHPGFPAEPEKLRHRKVGYDQFTSWPTVQGTSERMPVPLPVNRNHIACVGSWVYLGGGAVGNPAQYNRGFWKFDMNDPQPVAYPLAETPEGFVAGNGVEGESPGSPDVFSTPGVLLHHPTLNGLVAILDGVFFYDLQADQWTDITPSEWPTWNGHRGVFGNCQAVYVPGLDAIFLRGMPSYFNEFRNRTPFYSGTWTVEGKQSQFIDSCVWHKLTLRRE